MAELEICISCTLFYIRGTYITLGKYTVVVIVRTGFYKHRTSLVVDKIVLLETGTTFRQTDIVSTRSALHIQYRMSRKKCALGKLKILALRI